MFAVPPTVLVTGASRGIGFAIAQKFADKGYSVMLSARNEDLLNERKAELPVLEENQVHGILPIDLSDPNADLSIDFPIDVLVNNAGIAKTGLLAAQSPQDIEAAVRVNFTAPMLLAKYAVRNMLRDKRKGSIVFIGSTIAHRAVVGSSVYGATKGGLETFTRGLAREVGPKGIRVNTIAPGLTDTDMGAGAINMAKSNALNPGTLIKPEGIADSVWHVVKNEYITGATLLVDNGYAT